MQHVGFGVLALIAIVGIVIAVFLWRMRGKQSADDPDKGYSWSPATDDNGLAIIDDVLRQQNPTTGQIGRTPMTWRQLRYRDEALAALLSDRSSSASSPKKPQRRSGGGASK